MEPGFVLIAERHVRPEHGEKLCDDSIPVPDFPGFNMPALAAA